MSVPNFTGKIVLSNAGLADVSDVPGTKIKWNATFSFIDNSGKYLGTDVQLGDLIALDTGTVDTGTITSYLVIAIMNSTFNSFTVLMEYSALNNNPNGAPDIAITVDQIGYIGRRSPQRKLASVPATSIQIMPEVFADHLLNDNTNNILDKDRALNLQGGDLGMIPYQTAPDITSFVPAGTTGQVLTSIGTAAPVWTTLPSTVATLTTARTIAASGDAVWSVSFNGSANVTSALTLAATGIAAGTYKSVTVDTKGRVTAGTNPTTLAGYGITDAVSTTGTVANANNITGGAAGAVHYQSAVGVTAFTAVGTSGYILQSNGAAAPTWISPSSIVVTNSTTTTNVGGGSAGVVLYQSAVGTTAFTAVGTSGQLLQSNGTTSPTWVSPSSITVNSSTTTTNITGGATGSLVYQSAAGTTAFLAAGTSGYVLTSTGTTTAPSWQALSATTQAIGTANATIATTAFVDRLRSSQLTTTTTTAAITDRGNTISLSAGITIPANIFASGDVFSVYNNTATSLTLTSGAGLTLWLVGTATTGNRTIAQRGIATIYYISATEAVITGGGLT